MNEDESEYDEDEYDEFEYDDEDEHENGSDNKTPEGYSVELTGGSFGYLRYRDEHTGRFANPYESIDPEIEKERQIEREADRKLNKFLKNYRKKVNLPHSESRLLLILVNRFENNNRIYDSKGYMNPKICHFKRMSYHKVLLDCGLKRSCFCLLVKRLVEKNYIRKIQHGRKLYLKITELGLKKIYDYYEEFMLSPFL